MLLLVLIGMAVAAFAVPSGAQQAGCRTNQEASYYGYPYCVSGRMTWYAP